MSSPKTLAEKVWNRHVVHEGPGEPDLLYIDLHLVHEVTSPQAFDGLRLTGRTVRRPDLTIATEDHNVPTVEGHQQRHQEGRHARGRHALGQLLGADRDELDGLAQHLGGDGPDLRGAERL